MTTVSQKVQEVLTALESFKEPNYKYSSIPFTREQSEDFLHYFFENNKVAFIRTRQHILLLNQVLKQAKNLRYGTKKKVFALIYLNYTLSTEEKKSLYARFKMVPSTLEKKLLVDTILNTEPDLLKQRIRRATLNSLLTHVDYENNPSWANFYLGASPRSFGQNWVGSWSKQKIDEDGEKFFEVPEVSKEEKSWAMNQAYVISFFRSKTENIKIFERSAFYIRYYNVPRIKEICENESIFNPKSVLDLIFENKVPQVAGKKTVEKIYEDHKSLIQQSLLDTYPLLENFDGIMNSVPNMISMKRLLKEGAFHVFGIHEFLSGKRFKQSLEHLFGFHSTALIGALKKKSESENSKKFLEFLARGSVAKQLIGREQIDYNWKFMSLPLGVDILHFLKTRGNRFEELLTKEQIIMLFQNSQIPVNHRSQILAMQFLQDSVYQLTPAVIDSLKLIPFNDINNLQKLHDVTSREYARLKHKPFSLEIEKKYPSIIKFDETKLSNGMVIKFPKTNIDLVYWGAVLRNCVGSYSTTALEGVSLIVGVFEGEKVKFCVELRRTENEKKTQMYINQFKGYANEDASKEIRDMFQDWLPQSVVEEFNAFKPKVVSQRRNPILFMINEEPLPDIDLVDDE